MMISPFQSRTAPQTISAPVAAPATASQTRFYVPALDGLRVLAFTGVFVFHAGSCFDIVKNHPAYLALTAVGSFGVPLFFVLSAFLITRLLLLEKERNGRVDLRAYYARRTLRIWPLYFLVVVVGAVLAHHLHEPFRGSLIPMMTFTANWYHGRWGAVPSTLGTLWSVSVEEQFYVVWPLVLSLVAPRYLKNVCYGMIVAALVGRCLITHDDHAWVMTWLSTTSHLDSLALGTLLALNSDRIRSFIKAQGAALMALCVVGMAVVNLTFPLYGPSLIKGAIVYTVVPFLCAALVGLALGTKGTFLARPRLAAFGKLTFGLYMWHMMGLVVVKPHTVPQVLACLLGTVAIAALTYYGFERPFLSLKSRFERVQTRLA